MNELLNKIVCLDYEGYLREKANSVWEVRQKKFYFSIDKKYFHIYTYV